MNIRFFDSSGSVDVEYAIPLGARVPVEGESVKFDGSDPLAAFPDQYIVKQVGWEFSLRGAQCAAVELETAEQRYQRLIREI